MQLQFKGTNYELTPEVTNQVTKKFDRVKKYLGTREDNAHAYIDMGKVTEAHVSGNVWYADCNLKVAGKQYYAKAEAVSLRNAVDKMVGELGREIRSAQAKEKSLLRKKGSHLKDFFRFGR